jgi:hypothetical protein
MGNRDPFSRTRRLRPVIRDAPQRLSAKPVIPDALRRALYNGVIPDALRRVLYNGVIPDAPQRVAVRRRSGTSLDRSRVCGAALHAAPRTG